MRPLALLLIASLAYADPPADAPQQPHTLLFPDGGRCENAAAAKAEDKLLADARAQKVEVLAVVGTGFFVLGVVVGVLVQPLTKPKP